MGQLRLAAQALQKLALKKKPLKARAGQRFFCNARATCAALCFKPVL